MTIAMERDIATTMAMREGDYDDDGDERERVRRRWR